MQITKVLGIESDLETSSGSATSISQATCVRLYNGAGAATTIAISTSVGASASYTFSLPSDSVEFLQKLPTDVIWSSSSGIKAVKVGFTN